MNMYTNRRPHLDIMPAQWFGNSNFQCDWNELDGLKDLPHDTFFALWLKIPSNQQPVPMLPQGHSLYVIGWLDEPFDHEWFIHQISNIKAPVIVLNDGWIYDFPIPENVFFYQFHSWHHQVEKIRSWFPGSKTSNPRYKVSAMCNRITQSKLLIFTAIMRYIKKDHALVGLSKWLEEKNVHHRALTGDNLLDDLQTTFFRQWYGQEIKIDDFDNITHNFQRYNSNPWQPLYTDAAIHFTNESYHYSLMQDSLGHYTRPGPCLSEKTYACLVAGTPFISVAQFDVYRSLKQLGFQFDYGEIDLSWDNDAGNVSRLKSIVMCIESLSQMHIVDLVNMTKHSREHNVNHVWSGDFSRLCQEKNSETINQILQDFG